MNGKVCIKIGNPPIWPTPIKTGYYFEGWFPNDEEQEDRGNKVEGTDAVARTDDHTLYAYWAPNKYRINFNPNGEKATVRPPYKEPYYKEVIYNQAYGELANADRPGYTFNGWYTQASGGIGVTADTIVTQETINPNDMYGNQLYAHWTPNTYTVTFNANGGGTPNPTSETVTYANTYGTLATVSRTGYTFAGWYTAASGGTEVTSDTTVTTAANHTIYARWTKETYTITYAKNTTDSVAHMPASATKTYGEDLTLSSQRPTRTGYDFLGWSTDNNATSASYNAGGTFRINANTTLYAVWKKQDIPVTSITLNKTGSHWIPLKNNGSAGTLSISATVNPSNATNKTVTWTSSNNSVATVSGGTVTARGAGKVTITATAGGKSASVTVYVYNAIFKNPNNYDSSKFMYNDRFEDIGTFRFGKNTKLYAILKSTSKKDYWILDEFKIIDNGSFSINLDKYNKNYTGNKVLQDSGNYVEWKK